jgi:hypothetical protein
MPQFKLGIFSLTFVIVSLVGVAMTIGSLVVIRGSMSVTSVRLDLDGFRIDDVLDLLVTGGLVVVADVLGINVPLGVVTFTIINKMLRYI